MKPRLTEKDFARAAKRLGCETAAIKAVAHVESRAAGFDHKDRPVILFERHKFAKYTQGAYVKTHPHICNWTSGGYGKSSEQYNRFNEAFYLNAPAAMMSASWGKFQIMGFNFASAGFPTVHAFVDAMKESEGRQLDAFCAFIESNNLADELRRKDWEGFARGYNGQNYWKNKYDIKMASAYKAFKASEAKEQAKLADAIEERLDEITPATTPSETDPQPSASQPTAEQGTTEQPNNPADHQSPNLLDSLSNYAGKASDVAEKASTPLDQIGKISQSSLWTTITSKFGAWGLLGFGLFENKLPIIIIGAVILLSVLIYLHFSKKRATERIVSLGGSQ